MNKKELKTSRIVKNIRRSNKNNDNIVYKVGLSITIIVSIFIFLTAFMQINWFNPEITPQPLITWIVAQPYVGVFFIPFIVLLIGVSTFLMAIAKRVTIKSVLDDTNSLLEDEVLSTKQYDIIVNELNEAYKIQTKLTLERLEEFENKMKQNEIDLNSNQTKEIENGN